MASATRTTWAAAVARLFAALATRSFHPIWRDFGIGNQALIGYGLVTILTFFLYFTVVSLSGAVRVSQAVQIDAGLAYGVNHNNLGGTVGITMNW